MIASGDDPVAHTSGVGRLGTPWSGVLDTEPGFASEVQRRFESHPHHVIATLHVDGRPRVSGTNVGFDDHMMWIGTMPGSRKGADLIRDPRCALHSAPLDEDLSAGSGDATVDALAVRLDDTTARRLLTEEFGADATMDGELWSLSIRSMSLVEVQGEQLRIRSWAPHSGLTEVLRD